MRAVMVTFEQRYSYNIQHPRNDTFTYGSTILMTGRYFFLILPLLLWGVGAFAQTPSLADPFVGDSRLQAKRTLRFVDATMQDFLADLTQQTGVAFFTDPSVAEDRLNLFVFDRPLADTLRAVAAFFQFEWVRTGSGGQAGYTLRQNVAIQRREEEIRSRNTLLAAELLREETEVFARYAALTDDQRLTLSAELEERLLKATDPDAKRGLQIEYNMVRQLQTQNDWIRIVYAFLRTQSKEQILQLLKSGMREYAWPPAAGCEPLPEKVIEEARRGRNSDDRSGMTISSINFVRMRLTADPLREPRLRWSITAGRRTFNTHSMFTVASNLPVTSLSGTLPPQQAAEPEGWRDDTELSAPLPAEPPAAPREPAAGNVTNRGRGEIEEDGRPGFETRASRPSTLGEGLRRLTDRKPIHIIADSFWTSLIRSRDIRGETVGDALTYLARQTNHRWWKQDGFVMVKSLEYESDRWSEPPAEAMQRWIERSERSQLDLDDFAEMAALPEHKYNTLNELSVRGIFNLQMYIVTQARDHLQLWNLLSRSQRRKARAEGILYADMTPEQKRLYQRIATDPLSPSIIPSRTRESQAQTLEKASLRLETREQPLWSVRGKPNMIVGSLSSREEALRYFQQSDPKLQLKDIRDGVSVSISFIYQNDNRQLARGWVTLPPRWEN